VIGGRNGAAARLGLPRTTLLYKMQRLGINRGRNYFEFADVARSSD
jgi:DNA-binding NtrC family response regulator